MDIHQMPGHWIRRLQQVSTQVFKQRVEEAGFDLTPVQFAALQALKSDPGIEQARVAALIGYDRATIGGVIDRLEQKGLITRVVSSRDKRARQVSLSEPGRDLLEAMTPVVQALQGEILGKLAPDERAAFVALARRAVGGDEEAPVEASDGSRSS